MNIVGQLMNYTNKYWRSWLRDLAATTTLNPFFALSMHTWESFKIDIELTCYCFKVKKAKNSQSFNRRFMFILFHAVWLNVFINFFLLLVWDIDYLCGCLYFFSWFEIGIFLNFANDRLNYQSSIATKWSATAKPAAQTTLINNNTDPTSSSWKILQRLKVNSSLNIF